MTDKTYNGWTNIHVMLLTWINAIAQHVEFCSLRRSLHALNVVAASGLATVASAIVFGLAKCAIKCEPFSYRTTAKARISVLTVPKHELMY